MAVAGLQSVYVLDPSFHGESQSPLSRQWGNHDRPSTRASSILQMWQEIESEHMVSHSQFRVGDRREQRIDVSNADLPNPYLSEELESDSGHEDGSSSTSEQSTEFGEAERERVRLIFQKWMNSGVRGHASNVYPVNSYSREQMTSQQRGICAASGEEQTTESGAQIEQGCDGLVVYHRKICGGRNLRKLCGRQALLDLLARAEHERQRELQNLLECHLVSRFVHRNRIQTLLRGRFLQSGRLVPDERPSSMPASELGLLRQRHTVSGIREEFLARVDNFIHCPSSHAKSDTSSRNDTSDFINEQNETNNSRENLDAIQEQSQPNNGGGDIIELHTVTFEGNAGQDINWREANTPEEHVGFIGNKDSEQLQSSDFTSFGSRDGLGEYMGENSVVSIGNACSQETSGNEIEEKYFHPRPREMIHEQNVPSSEEQDMYTSSNHLDVHEINTVEEVNWPNTIARVEQWPEPITDNEDNDSRQTHNIEFPGSLDDNAAGKERNWRGGTDNHWYQEMLASEGDDLDHMQDLDEQGHEDGRQEAVDDLSEGPSSREATPVGRVDNTSYFPDYEDNVYSTEIRELLSRRSVSSLLRSDFRVSLDQLIQSYAERQAHALVVWEMDEPSPSLREVEEDVQQSGGQNLGLSGVFEVAPTIALSPEVVPSQPFWDLELQDDNWLQNNTQQHLGIEWEIINDLRIDMARLQQRMDNMQRMLEACMDKQLELQRSIRQEVSAAMNKSHGSTEGDDSLQMVESKWDHVSKGLCCICCCNSLYSLLYRCGHMCTCSKCADELVQGRGNCPMCQTPVVETVRAYSIL